MPRSVCRREMRIPLLVTVGGSPLAGSGLIYLEFSKNFACGARKPSENSHPSQPQAKSNWSSLSAIIYSLRFLASGTIPKMKDDVTLKPYRGVLTFSVEEGHIDIENSDEAISDIFDPGGTSPGSP
jgi:hypothetical protein